MNHNTLCAIGHYHFDDDLYLISNSHVNLKMAQRIRIFNLFESELLLLYIVHLHLVKFPLLLTSVDLLTLNIQRSCWQKLVEVNCGARKCWLITSLSSIDCYYDLLLKFAFNLDKFLTASCNSIDINYPSR